MSQESLTEDFKEINDYSGTLIDQKAYYDENAKIINIINQSRIEMVGKMEHIANILEKPD